MVIVFVYVLPLAFVLASVAWTCNSFNLHRTRSVLEATRRDDGIEPLHHDDANWEILSELATLRSPWLTLINERYRDDRGQLLDYWRVEKADSAVIVTIHRDRLVFPRATFRPGVNRKTLDFPGGRVVRSNKGNDLVERVVPAILQRELGVTPDQLDSVQALNQNEDKGWPINSSFSNQSLFGFIVKIQDEAELNPALLHPRSYDVNCVSDIKQLLREDLKCLQCRAVLLEWLYLKEAE